MAPRGALAWGLIAAASWLALTLPFLDRSRLQDSDELTHARVARAAAVEGRVWPLMYGDRVFYEKPPLQVWLAAATAWVSGQPLAAWPYRLCSCLGAALALGALAWILASAGSPWAGLFAAALLALQGDWLFHARFFSFDACYVGLALASLAAGLAALTGPPRRWWLAGALLGLDVWFKSWFVLALAPAWAWAVGTQLPAGRRRAVAWRLALPVALALALWVALYVSWNGWAFLREEWSENLMGRALGRTNVVDPQGHAAFYLKWAQRSSPALLPLVLSLPLGLGASPGAPQGPASRFARAFAWALCASWAAGLWLQRAETINYSLPLEAGLCLALGLAVAEGGGAAAAWALTALLLACAAASLRLWPPAVSLGLGLPLGLALAWARRRAGAPLRWPLGFAAAALLLLLLPEAWRLEAHPLDGSAELAALVEAHPARWQGEPLVLLGPATQAADFYSAYQVVHPVTVPAQRPREACAVKLGEHWVFYPAQDAPATPKGHGQQTARH
jgi:hypothetical protein